jgi:hypothetical protein
LANRLRPDSLSKAVPFPESRRFEAFQESLEGARARLLPKC